MNAVFMLLFTLLAIDPWAQEQIDATTRGILADDAYAFCHDEEYPLIDEEAGWCPMVAEAAARCPALPEVCRGKRAELRGAPGRLSARRVVEGEPEAPERAGGGGPSRRQQRPEPEPKEIEVPSLGGFAEILFWLVVAVTVIGLLWAVFSNAAAGGDSDTEAKTEPSAERNVPAPDEAARRAMETDVDRLLDYATDAAKRGEFDVAVDFSHAALLRRLDHEGMIHLHKSRTNGDYVRDLRRHPDWRTPVREALRRVDRAQFGTESPTRTVFDEIFSRVKDIVKRAAPLGVWLLIATTLGCDTDPAKSYPWETSPSGLQATMALLEQHGVEAQYHSGSLAGLEDDSFTTVVMLPGSDASVEEWEYLEEWVEQGGTLIVAGAAVPPWIEGVSVRWDEPGAQVDPVRVHRDQLAAFDQPMVFLPEGYYLDVSAPEHDIVLQRGGERAWAISVGGSVGQTIVMADGNLFSNASLAYGDNATFLMELLRWGGPTTNVHFVDAWASAGADNPFDSVRRSNLTPAVIQLLLLVLVLYLWRGIRFGKGRDPKAPSRLAFTQHARAMGQQYRKARAVDHAAKLYASWALERLRDRFPIAARGGLSGLANAVARRSGRDETEILRLLVEAHTAAESAGDGRDDGSRGETIRFIRNLGSLMRQSGGHK